jgi:hypothetical protein
LRDGTYQPARAQPVAWSGPCQTTEGRAPSSD